MGVQLVLTLRKFRSKKISIFAGYEDESYPLMRLPVY